MKQYARTQAEAEALQARLNAQLTHLVSLRITDYDQPLAEAIAYRQRLLFGTRTQRSRIAENWGNAVGDALRGR
jgi:hypothetical protein